MSFCRSVSSLFVLAGVALAGTASAQSIPWPGAGAGQPNPGAGYPPVSFWKEEGVIGNNWINSMLDQNATWFDIYFPGAGGVQGVGTKNEGYVDGLDTFPPLLPPDNRGQMHINQMMVGVRVDGLTHWLSNPSGVSFDQVTQAYLPDTQTIRTTQRLFSGGANIQIEQFDFSPKGANTTAPNDNKTVLVKRMILTSPVARTVQVYLYMDPAINGGDNFDFMFYDPAVGSMVAYDKTFRVVTNTGPIGFGQEYNPTTFPGGYEKNIALYLGAQMKVLSAVGGAGGTTASANWREVSGDNSQGWIGQDVALPANTPVEVNFIVVGGSQRPIPSVDQIYDNQLRPVFQWFQGTSAQSLQNATDAFWQDFLQQGVTISTPDSRLNTLFNRGILTTMLHFDERNGGLIAGYRNGAYPYVWPRDMAWAGVTLARVGHTDTVRAMTRFLRDATFREFETWTPGNTPPVEAAGGTPFFGTRKGFWKQKYTTDGFVIWGAPQVDETAVIPWMVRYLYNVTGDAAYLTEAQVGNPNNTTYAIVKDAAIAMSQTSKNDPTRLNHRPSYPGASTLLIYSNNIWEDQYDTFIYSNANIVRGLRDAAGIAETLGQTADRDDFLNRANGILAGLNDKLDWNRENTDASLLGIVYPFETHSPVDPRAARIIDRINGVAPDGNGQFRPLVRFAGEYLNDASDYVGLIDRYWGDSYWGNTALGPTRAGPWFLTTMWYGVYYAYRADFTAGKADIDNHLFRLNRTADHNGPIGLGAEQMAPSNSLQYPGQADFTLQTAWPNAWESMSFYVDSMMQFIDYSPDATANTLRVSPKLPSAWNTMTFNNLEVGASRASVTVTESSGGANQTQAFTRTAGTGDLLVATSAKVPAGWSPCSVRVNGTPVSYQWDAVARRLAVSPFALAQGGTATLVVLSRTGNLVDFNQDGQKAPADIFAFLTAYFANDPRADFDGNGSRQPADIFAFLSAYFSACP